MCLRCFLTVVSLIKSKRRATSLFFYATCRFVNALGLTLNGIRIVVKITMDIFYPHGVSIWIENIHIKLLF
jgi:hypothetical protein